MTQIGHSQWGGQFRQGYFFVANRSEIQHGKGKPLGYGVSKVDIILCADMWLMFNTVGSTGLSEKAETLERYFGWLITKAPTFFITEKVGAGGEMQEFTLVIGVLVISELETHIR